MSAGRPANAAAAWNAESTSDKGMQVGKPFARWSDSTSHNLELHNISVPSLEAAQDINLWASLEAYVNYSVRLSFPGPRPLQPFLFWAGPFGPE